MFRILPPPPTATTLSVSSNIDMYLKHTSVYNYLVCLFYIQQQYSKKRKALQDTHNPFLSILPQLFLLRQPSLARSGPGNRLNPKSFDKHMRKPSMRFGRAGTASRTGADAFLNSGEDLDEEDEEDESDRRPPDKSNEQSRRLSVSAGRRAVSRCGIILLSH